MRYVTIVISIVIFWILLATFLTQFVRDPILTNPSFTGNDSLLVPDTGLVNMSQAQVPDETTLFSFFDAMKIMFGFRMPVSTFPSFLADFMSLINWILVILMGISLYKIANPISSA